MLNASLPQKPFQALASSAGVGSVGVQLPRAIRFLRVGQLSPFLILLSMCLRTATVNAQPTNALEPMPSAARMELLNHEAALADQQVSPTTNAPAPTVNLHAAVHDLFQLFADLGLNFTLTQIGEVLAALHFLAKFFRNYFTSTNLFQNGKLATLLRHVALEGFAADPYVPATKPSTQS